MAIASVTYEEERTFNTGDYENTKIRIGVSFTCDNDQADEFYDKAKDFVLDNLDAEEKSVRKSAKSKKQK